jgi:hypothetical protein
VVFKTLSFLAEIKRNVKRMFYANYVTYLRFRKYSNSLLTSMCDKSSLPVCFEKALKSRTEPGSVAITRKTSPVIISAKAFFAFKIGSGQFNPRASSSLLNCMILPVTKIRIAFEKTNKLLKHNADNSTGNSNKLCNATSKTCFTFASSQYQLQ